ncbi:MAG TPA: tRNA (N6-isopentenyl adenosine(37)-C2)-methylthiotransferase MiaB [Planctomycetaceae bacterium]|nr:tRNA (N6-isopentenyl adenosine(37)-C2)-methylthiotransferase MiaB [Planctomycetaceae bacterium]
MTKSFFIETVGCQMNVLDSELVASSLLERGYAQAESAREADVLLFNTCSVRQHAEDKIYSALGRLKHAKKHRPSKLIGVVGCMAQKDGALIFRRAPHVDLVVGPSQLGRLPELIDEAAAGPVLAVSADRNAETHREARASFVPFNPARRAETRGSAHQAMVRVAFGCDHFCSYCIVPSVRGPDQSRPIEQIEEEVRRLARQAMRQGVAFEATLIGQTVNSYRYRDGDKTYRMADLLERLNPIEGLSRLKFVTNHPRYMTQDLLDAVRDLEKVAPYLHVPAQSGSDRMLRLMRRGYTSAEYREMLGRIRETIPGAAVTSDFIVGFCGETEAEFLETVELVRDARFKNSFIFKYSPRSGTHAAEHLDDDVPEEEKRRRNNELLAVQNAISEEDNRAMAGRTVEILVEGPSKASIKRESTDENSAEESSAHSRLSLRESSADKHNVFERDKGKNEVRRSRVPESDGSDSTEREDIADATLLSRSERRLSSPQPDAIQLVGRTADDRMVVFDGTAELIGQIVQVEIERTSPFTLFGRIS